MPKSERAPMLHARVKATRMPSVPTRVNDTPAHGRLGASMYACAHLGGRVNDKPLCQVDFTLVSGVVVYYNTNTPLARVNDTREENARAPKYSTARVSAKGDKGGWG